jgi:hypothetical protein
MMTDEAICYCDFLYKPEGHFDDDFKILKSFSNDHFIHIKENIKKQKGVLKKIGLIKKYFYKSNNNIVASVSYIYLFLYSIMFRSFNYKLIIHFIPTKNFFLYRIILSIIINNCKSVAVFDDCVREDIYKKCFVKKEIKIIHARTVQNASLKQEKDHKKILMIGKMNGTKNIMDILNVLKLRKYDKLAFSFLCKDVSFYFKDFDNVYNNDIYTMDEYIDTVTYKNEIESADFLLLPYKKEYGTRSSAAFLDSLILGTPVIASNLFCFRSMIDRYHCGIVYSNQIELADIFNKIGNNELQINISHTFYEDFGFDNNKRLFYQFLYDGINNGR